MNLDNFIINRMHSYSRDIIFEEKYFSFEQVKNIPDIIAEYGKVDDFLLVPYILNSKGHIMELYWLILSIRLVFEVQDKTIFYLSETGKQSINEIEPKYIEIMDNTYYEVLIYEVDKFIGYVNRYIKFIKNRQAEINEYKLSIENSELVFWLI